MTPGVLYPGACWNDSFIGKFDFNIFHGIISFESEFLRRLYLKNASPSR